MATNLLPISSDGGFVTAGNITTASYASPAPTLSGFSTVSSDNIRLMNGDITGGIATVVDDGINSIALALGAQMDVFGFPFSQITRGQLTISSVLSPSEVNGTWYYQSVNTNTYQIYTDSTYSTLVDATGWSAYTGGGEVAITKQNPAANIVINSNGFLSKFINDGQVILPGSLATAGDIGTDSDITGSNISAVQDITAGGNLDIDGEGTIGGNLVIVGNIDFSGGGTINQITSPFGYFTGNTDGANALYAGVPGGTIVPGAVAQFTGDANAYIQINAQNKNHGTQASMEWVVTGDLGSDTTDYLDLGFSSSAWDGTQDNSLGTAVAARDGYMYVQGGGGGGNLVLGTTTTGTKIKFNAGGPNSANTVATIDVGGFTATGNVTAGHLKGEAGNISNVPVANITGLGNIATINLTGSASNVLYGNGVFAAPASGSSSNIANGNSNVNIATANGNVTIAAVGNTTMTITGTGANITGTANITGNVVMANLSFSANAGQINFNTTAYITGNANSLGRDGSILLSPYTGAGSTFPGVIIGGAGRLLAPNGSVHQVFNTSDVTFNVAIKNITGTAATSTTSGALQISGGGGFTTNVYVGGSLVRTGAVTQTAWTTNGVGLRIPTSTYTDNSTAAGTQASSYVNTMDAPVLAFSNAVTVTNAATLFVAAPTAGTNATITSPYAMIANGAVQINGNLTANTNGFAIGYRDLPQVAASNTTLSATDGGKHYYSTTAGNLTLTIPNNATTSFATGTAISIVVQAAGNILVNASSGVTLYMAGNSTAANRYVNAYGMATLLKVGTDTWFINGTGVN